VDVSFHTKRRGAGLSRFSWRSLCNVLAFMGAGMATVWGLRQLSGA
jgi:hypothetical protein